MTAALDRKPTEPTTSSYLGSWQKAPLVYLVFEVLLPPLLTDYDALLNKFSDQLIKEYPLISDLNSQSVNVTNQGIAVSSVMTKHFVNIRKDAGISISQGHLSFHVSKYAKSTAMMEEFQRLLRVFGSIFPERPILSTSMRVIDVVTTSISGLKSISEAVVDSFKAPSSPQGLKLNQHLSVASFSNDGEIQCTLKSYGNVVGLGLLPADLSPLPLNLFGPSSDALECAKNGQPFGVIDTYAADVSVEVWSVERVAVRMAQIKQLMHSIFLHATTEEARRYWQTGNRMELN
jgi:uncharacterized protein (TIGR04255 family)